MENPRKGAVASQRISIQTDLEEALEKMNGREICNNSSQVGLKRPQFHEGLLMRTRNHKRVNSVDNDLPNFLKV